MFGTSWLGLGERNWLGHTEELLGVLATATNGQLEDRPTATAWGSPGGAPTGSSRPPVLRPRPWTCRGA